MAMNAQTVIQCALLDREKLKARLSKHLQPSGDCLLWTGARYPTGYGLIWVCGTYSTTAHRVSLLIATGKPFEFPFEAGHVKPPVCLHRTCCNPEHLTWKTHPDNMKQVFEEKTEGNARLMPQSIPTGNAPSAERAALNEKLKEVEELIRAIRAKENITI